MSLLSRFDVKYKTGHIRYLIDGTDTIHGYLKCDGSIVNQADYPVLFAIVGLLTPLTYNTLTQFALPTTNQLPFNSNQTLSTTPSAFIKT